MVWIHGGAFTSGMRQANWAPTFVEEAGVVVVSVDYRLSVFGFWADPSGAAPANLGLRDQIAALEWVRRNIRSFGGDPNRVTIFGQSAGGTAVLALYQSPLATGLFQQGIAQSPATRPAYFQVPSSLAASTMGRACLEALGCNDVACLRRKSVDEFLNCSDYFYPEVFTTTPGIYFSGFDGEVLPQSIIAPVCQAQPTANGDKPLMLGSMTDEWRLLDTFGWNSPATLDLMLSAKLRGYKEGSAELKKCAQARVLEPYAGDAAGSCQLCDRFKDDAPLVQLLGDSSYTQSAQLVGAAPGGVRYRYLLDLGPTSSQLGSTHTVDICFFYKDPSVPCQSGGRLGVKRETARLIREYWTTFAITGIPRSRFGPRWEPVNSSSAPQGLPMLHVQLGDRGRNTAMTSRAWYSDAAARLLPSITCGTLSLSNGSNGRCELVPSGAAFGPLG